jgi:GNAT superfamily N-acetyltransferase
MLHTRIAKVEDLPALKVLMDAAIGELQKDFLAPEEVVASRGVMGIDTQLVRDGTYFLVEIDGALAGCGGWSRRSTLYGGDHSTELRNDNLLDPKVDAARVRAMYTHPDFTRRGVGRAVLAASEAAAKAEGFSRVELMATLSGEPLYRACGYVEIERVHSPPVDGVRVPLVRMGKPV